MKLMKWLLKISLTAVLVSTLTILTTGIVVNAYLQSVLASFNIQLEGQPVGVGGIMKSFFGMNTVSEGKEGQTSGNELGDNGTESGSQGINSGTDSDTESGDSKAGTRSADEGTPEEGGTNQEVEGNNPPDNSLPVMGGVYESAADQQVVMTPDEMVDKKSSLTTKEKEEIFTLLMTKLPQEEMQKISAAMEEGLTAAELDDIEKGISKYLSEEEFKKLMTLLEK